MSFWVNFLQKSWKLSYWGTLVILWIHAFLPPKINTHAVSVSGLENDDNPLKVVLVLQYYEDKSDVRRIEIEYAMCMNFLNNNIDEIHLIQNTKNLLKGETIAASCQKWFINPEIIERKLKIYRGDDIAKGRLKLGQAFRYAATYAGDSIILISNSDIYYDDSLALLKTNPNVRKDLLQDNVLYYLSRYETDQTVSVGTQCSTRYQGSHDTIVFYSSLQSPILNRLPDHVMIDLGSWGIESFVFYQAFLLSNDISYVFYSITIFVCA